MGILEDQKDEIISLYKKYNSIRDISSILSCSFSGVKRILHKYNVKMRNKCESLNLCPSEFNKNEYEFVLGTILGDGHITKKRGKNGESQLYIGHSIKQKGYIQYKYSLLYRFIGCKIYPLKHTLENNKTYLTLNFVTRKSGLFTKLREQFYSNKKKIIPFDILGKDFTLFSLAIFYMDDGYNCPNRGCEINTQSFSKNENELFSLLLKDKFNINSHLVKVKGGSGWKIYINKKDKIYFFNLIKPYIVEDMRYKII